MIRAAYVLNGPGGVVLRSMGCIPTSRKLKVEAEGAAVDALRAGQLVCMMPEGRIVPPPDRVNGVGTVRPGLSRIARAANALVLPVGLSHTEKVWPRDGRPRLGKRTTVAVRIGDPIDLTTDDHTANMEEVMAAVGRLIIDRE